MRLLFLILLIPAHCYAIGFESCKFVGKKNGKTVTLSYIEDAVYGLENSNTYGYCKEVTTKKKGVLLPLAAQKKKMGRSLPLT